MAIITLDQFQRYRRNALDNNDMITYDLVDAIIYRNYCRSERLFNDVIEGLVRRIAMEKASQCPNHPSPNAP